MGLKPTVEKGALNLLTASLIAALLVALGASAAVAAEGGAGDQAPAVEPAAMQALEAMSAYLRTLDSFSIKAEASADAVRDDGQKIQFDWNLSVDYAKGKGLKVDSVSPFRHLTYFYDYKHLTLFSPDMRYYASTEAQPTIVKTLDEVSARYGIEFPLADLFFWGTERLPANAIKSAVTIGPGRVHGEACRHYAYRQADVDFQLCIADGNHPLPLKLVITTTAQPEQPQYEVRMTWDLKPHLAADEFTFTPPRDALPVTFRPMPAVAAGKP
jgi:hypothetical protein